MCDYVFVFGRGVVFILGIESLPYFLKHTYSDPSLIFYLMELLRGEQTGRVPIVSLLDMEGPLWA